MAGPKLGPRPPDFDEARVRRSPTFRRWLLLPPGSELVYACRTFVKGGIDDEERLMRRIMIARRANLRDHDVLVRAREEVDDDGVDVAMGGGTMAGSTRRRRSGAGATTTTATATAQSTTTGGAGDDDVDDGSPSPSTATVVAPGPRRTLPGMAGGRVGPRSDEDVLREMDVHAVESTRSYRRWTALADGEQFAYNQTYVKGRDGHDWLLRKNIWRRMRYRRMNRARVESMRARRGTTTTTTMTTTAMRAGLRREGRRGEEEEIDDDDDDDDDGGRPLVDSRAAEDAAAAAAAGALASNPSFDGLGVVDADAVAALGGGAAASAESGDVLNVNDDNVDNNYILTQLE
ncbi:hypothetical protein ACHAW5_000382 [Stephanodiscus triporus]|uniref:Uncharacterized protein n=1 Tax=Stephanodiscus triporus TaxID=2934178 RepID=A0ABD3N4I0_9STRA